MPRDERSSDHILRRDRALSPFGAAILVVAGMALAFASLLVSGSISPIQLISAGSDGPSRAVIVSDFGEASLPSGTGYDGQQTYAIARDFPDVDAMAANLDAPRYRLLRILPPAVASLAPTGTPTVLALLAVNLGGIGLAVWGSARLLGPPYSALHGAAGAVPLLFGVVLSTTEPIAWGSCLAALSCTDRGRHRISVALFIVAVLSRETAAVVPTIVGLATFLTGNGTWPVKLRLLALYAVPGAVAVTWYFLAGMLAGGTTPDRFEFLGVLHLPAGHVVVSTATFLVGLVGTYAWRDRKEIAATIAVFTVWMAWYTSDILHTLAVVRVNGLALGLGLLGVIRLRRQVRPLAPPRVDVVGMPRQAPSLNRMAD